MVVIGWLLGVVAIGWLLWAPSSAQHTARAGWHWAEGEHVQMDESWMAETCVDGPNNVESAAHRAVEATWDL